MLIFSGVWAIAKGMNSCQCFGRVSRPAASSFLYSGVAGRGVIKPKIGSPGGQLRIPYRVRSATQGVSLSMPKIKEVMAKTLRWASRSSTTAYSPGLLKPFFTSARLAGSMDSIPMKIHLPPAAAIRSTRSEEHTSELQSRLHLVCRLLLEKKNRQHGPQGRLPSRHRHHDDQRRVARDDRGGQHPPS